MNTESPSVARATAKTFAVVGCVLIIALSCPRLACAAETDASPAKSQREICPVWK